MADTLIKRIGGKFSIRSWIISNLPRHDIFCEPFGGSFAVGLAVNTPRLVYNDLDSHIYNFFKVIRDQPEEFARKVRLTPYSRQEFELACNLINDPSRPWLQLEPIERARLYLVYNRQSFAGKEDGSWCISKNGENIALTWNGLENLIHEMASKFKNAFIENSDYKDIFRRWDTEKTCFYIDPPYENVESDYYNVNKETGFNHVELAEEIKKLKGSVVISYYFSDSITNMYPGFDIVTKEVSKHMQTKNKKDKAQEILLIKKSQWAIDNQTQNGDLL